MKTVELSEDRWNAVIHNLLDRSEEFLGPSQCEPTEHGKESSEFLESLAAEINSQL